MAKTHLVSFSEIDTARQCAFKHRLSYKERWVGETKSQALNKGTLWHVVMENYYLVIQFFQQVAEGKWAPEFPAVTLPNDDVLEIAYKHAMLFLVDERGSYLDETAELIGWMFQGYVECYGIDPDWKILAVEQRWDFWLPTPRGGRSNFKIKLKLDLVIRDIPTDRLYVVDHKSGKNLPKDKELDIDDQFGLYIWGLRANGKNIFGAMHSAARTHRNKDLVKNPQPLEERFRRKPLYRTDVELQEVAVDAYKSARNAYLTPVGEEGRSPNSDTCRWRCDYLEACLLSRKGVPIKGTLESMGFVQNFERH